MTPKERREGIIATIVLTALFITGLVIETLDGWPLTIATAVAIAVVAFAVIAYKRSNK
jgi:nicotinamide riboside transporter PnuC